VYSGLNVGKYIVGVLCAEETPTLSHNRESDIQCRV
jgi:hypothetical protein